MRLEVRAFNLVERERLELVLVLAFVPGQLRESLGMTSRPAHGASPIRLRARARRHVSNACGAKQLVLVADQHDRTGPNLLVILDVAIEAINGPMIFDVTDVSTVGALVAESQNQPGDRTVV